MPPTPPTTSTTREALLDAAEGLFARAGYAGTGIREIAEASGANLAAVSYHFGSKEALYLATVRRVMERRESAAAWDALRPPHGSRRAAAAALVRFLRRFTALLLPTGDPPVTSCLILHEAAEPTAALDAVVLEFVQPHESALVETLRTIARDTVDDETLMLQARSILGQILHYRVFRPFLERLSGAGSLDDPGRIADHIARFSLRAVGLGTTDIEAAMRAAEGETT